MLDFARRHLVAIILAGAAIWCYSLTLLVRAQRRWKTRKGRAHRLRNLHEVEKCWLNLMMQSENYRLMRAHTHETLNTLAAEGVVEKTGTAFVKQGICYVEWRLPPTIAEELARNPSLIVLPADRLDEFWQSEKVAVNSTHGPESIVVVVHKSTEDLSKGNV